MPRPSITRRLIRQMSFADAKKINLHYGLPPRKSQEELASQIVNHVGTGLDTLVSATGPFLQSRWNEIAEELGGSPRNSFSSLSNELALSLDPVYDHLYGDMTISELRQSKSEKRMLARIFGLNRDALEQLLAEAHGGQHLSRFVTEYRKTAIALAKPPRRQLPLSVASTRVRAASVDRMSVAWMTRQMQGAEVLRIAAGFYDTVFLENVLKNCNAQTVCLVFNGLGGQRLHEQRHELEALCQKLARTRRKVSVRLSFAPGMFHTKLFLMTENGKTSALLGSANATSAAFSRNEEILVTLADAGALEGYFDAVWQDGKPLRSLVEPANSLINFFRTGILYFKPTATLSTTIHPFRELLKRMSIEERALLGGVELPFSDQASGVGPFNLKRALQEVASVDDWEERDSLNESDTSDTRVSIRPWSVETCFGYWVPSRLDSLWKDELANAGAVKRKKIEAFADALKKTDEDALIYMYQRYLDEVKKLLEGRIARLPFLLNSMERSPFDIAIFKKFVVRISSYLEEPSRIKRLAEPFISGAMPELWDDEEAYLDFRSSFFDYLDQVVRIKKSKAKVARIILDKLDIIEPIGDEAEWSSLFEDFLQQEPWAEADWTVALNVS